MLATMTDAEALERQPAQRNPLVVPRRASAGALAFLLLRAASESPRDSVKELLGDADDVRLDRAVRTYAA
jgi:hypothetical protein